MTGAGRYGDEQFEFSAMLGSVNEMLDPAASLPVDARIRIRALDLEVDLSGTFEVPLRISLARRVAE